MQPKKETEVGQTQDIMAKKPHTKQLVWSSKVLTIQMKKWLAKPWKIHVQTTSLFHEKHF